MKTLLTLLTLVCTVYSASADNNPNAKAVKMDVLKVMYSSKVDNYNSVSKANDALASLKGGSQNKQAGSNVIDEWTASTEDINAKYNEFESILNESFASKDGWASSKVKVNKAEDKSDIVYYKEGYGYVVLGFAKNDLGENALQLRVTPVIQDVETITAEIDNLNMIKMSR